MNTTGHGEPQQLPKGASCKQLPINSQLDCAAEVRFNVQAEAVQTELAIHMPNIYYTNLWQLLSVNVSERGEEIDFLKQSMALDESVPFIPRRIIILKCNKIFFCIKLRCLKCRYLNLVDCLVNLRKTFLSGTSFLYLNNNTPLLSFISFITSSEERHAFAVQKQDHSPRYVQ